MQIRCTWLNSYISKLSILKSNTFVIKPLHPQINMWFLAMVKVLKHLTTSAELTKSDTLLIHKIYIYLLLILGMHEPHGWRVLFGWNPRAQTLLSLCCRWRWGRMLLHHCTQRNHLKHVGRHPAWFQDLFQLQLLLHLVGLWLDSCPTI